MTSNLHVGLLLLPLLLSGCSSDPTSSAGSQDPVPLIVELPPRFAELPVPEHNPMTVAGVALGRRLFFDPLLSVDSTVSCASCHQPEFAFSDPAQFSQGVAGRTDRQSMSLANLAWSGTLFWDGRAESLEAQVLQPVANPVEMGETWENVERKLARHADYPALFESAFPGRPITRDLVAQAIAQYERTLISGTSRYDRFLRGEVEFTEQEMAGWTVYGTELGDCTHCHGGILLTDNRFHNNGLDETPEDAGRDAGRFRTPTLRNIELTAPYMHDGRFATLAEVLQHYNTGMHRSALLDPLLLGLPQHRLSDSDQVALIAFMKTLTDADFVAEHSP